MVPVWRGGAAERYEPCPKGRGEWSEACPDEAVVALDNVLAAYYEGTVINIKGESYRLKERKEFMRQKQQIVNTLFEQGST